eukprot:7201120-Pyramimonas_sp.AAC.1
MEGESAPPEGWLVPAFSPCVAQAGSLFAAAALRPPWEIAGLVRKRCYIRRKKKRENLHAGDGEREREF